MVSFPDDPLAWRGQPRGSSDPGSQADQYGQEIHPYDPFGALGPNGGTPGGDPIGGPSPYRQSSSPPVPTTTSRLDPVISAGTDDYRPHENKWKWLVGLAVPAIVGPIAVFLLTR